MEMLPGLNFDDDWLEVIDTECSNIDSILWINFIELINTEVHR